MTGLKSHTKSSFYMDIVCTFAYIMQESVCTGVNYSENVVLSDLQSMGVHWILALEKSIFLSCFFYIYETVQSLSSDVDLPRVLGLINSYLTMM